MYYIKRRSDVDCIVGDTDSNQSYKMIKSDLESSIKEGILKLRDDVVRGD